MSEAYENFQTNHVARPYIILRSLSQDHLRDKRFQNCLWFESNKNIMSHKHRSSPKAFSLRS